MKLFTRRCYRRSYIIFPGRQVLEPVLLKYAHVFHADEANDFNGTDVIKHQIPVGDVQPIRRPPYRTPKALRGEMKAQIEDMLRKGVIPESNFAWSAPAILVPKVIPDWKPKFMLCVDFWTLNSVTQFDQYTLPLVEKTTSTIFGSKYFSVLDCYSGFWQR
jgi:hypothetical protein